ncbi:hypothetical protein BDZ97DRAFT_721780 [Flammula alnicola]|nr:hypothetical protein BDZ97DRAFT_721780 [Flammula alnicola]
MSFSSFYSGCSVYHQLFYKVGIPIEFDIMTETSEDGVPASGEVLECATQGSSTTVHNEAEDAKTDSPGSNTDSSTNCPIASLPQELLAFILDMARSDTIPVNEAGARPLKEILITASQVSSFWRFVVLENPLWWSCITITPPWNLDEIETYLKRSQQCPLDLRIYVHLNYHTIRDEDTPLPPLHDYQGLRDILYPHFHRCRIFHFQGIFNKDVYLPFYLLEPLLDMDMPYLEEFTFDGELLHIPSSFKPVRKAIFSSAPRLRDIRLGGIGFLNFSPPLSSVTTLHLSKAMDKGDLTFQEFGSMLEACPCLTSLTVYDDLLSHWSDDLELTGCNVPLLETLCILGNMLSVSELLLFLLAPKLRELVIAPIVGGDLTLLLSRPRSFHQSHFPLLTSLTLAPAHPEAFEAVASASTCFPKVELLILANVYFAQFLDVFLEDSVVFPNLHDLAFTSIDKFIANEMPTVYAFRQSRNVPLRTMFVDTASIQKLSSHRHPWDDWSRINVVEANLWERQRRRALYSNVEDLFVGRPFDE